MKTHSLLPNVFLTIALLCHGLPAQTSPITDPLAEDAPEAVAAHIPMPELVVKSSMTQRVMREEPAPLPGMIPVRKVVNVTVQEVEDPHLPAPPVAQSVILSPEEIARFKAMAALRASP